MNQPEAHGLDEALARATLDEIAAQPLEDRADAVEALVARLESALDSTSVSDTQSGS
ncbi:MAG TPA: hypothetical protein VHJ40_03865 [Actinomycetota bacterium]|nr:hypothetical protein [Actinomycetota bacterium]